MPAQAFPTATTAASARPRAAASIASGLLAFTGAVAVLAGMWTALLGWSYIPLPGGAVAMAASIWLARPAPQAAGVATPRNSAKV